MSFHDAQHVVLALFPCLGWAPLANAAQLPRVARYEAFEAALSSARSYSNPFRDVEVRAEFRAPSGRALTALAFYDGGSTWKVRIAPDETGQWAYRTWASNASDAGLHGQSGGFTCTPSRRSGFIRPDPEARYWFSFSNGTPFFGLGDTCYGLATGVSDEQRVRYLDTRAAQGFNFVRFFASGYPYIVHPSLRDAPNAWPWGGSPSQPDYDRLNPEFFRRLEGILAEFSARGMHAELLLLNYYSKPFTDPSRWTRERQDLWLRYLVSRLSASPAVFLWTVTNEYEVYPNGSYSNLKGTPASDHQWAIQVAATVRGTDPHEHPVTTHPCEATDQGYHASESGEIGRRFGDAPEIGVLSHQVNTYTTAEWHPEPVPGFWDGPATGVSEAIAKDRRYDKPVINTESGYEWLQGHVSNYSQQAHSTDKCRRAAWRTLAAGGAAYAAGFAGTWHGRDGWHWRNWRTKTEEGPLPFILSDMGLARQIGYLSAFVMSKLDVRRFSPSPDLVNAPNLCLADPGREYMVYAPSGGEIALDLSAASGSFAVEWLNPRTGEYQRPRRVIPGGARFSLTAPDENDWVLHLRARR